jgi:hypothetical protein
VLKETERIQYSLGRSLVEPDGYEGLCNSK